MTQPLLAFTHDRGVALPWGEQASWPANQEAERGSLGRFFLPRKLQRWLTRQVLLWEGREPQSEKPWDRLIAGHPEPLPSSCGRVLISSSLTEEPNLTCTVADTLLLGAK